MKNFRDIGVPSINENNGSSIEKCDRINKYVWHAFRGHSAGWAVFCLIFKVATFLECL